MGSAPPRFGAELSRLITGYPAERIELRERWND